MIPNQFLGLEEHLDDEKLRRKLEKRVNFASKPCWELRYCPYGSLVEYYPLPNRTTRKEAIAHNERLKEVLKRNDLKQVKAEPLPALPSLVNNLEH